MMSATVVSAGAASSGYYKAEGYYAAGSPEAQQASSWFGKGAASLGLEGQVDDAIFTRMLEGQTFTERDGKLEPGRVMGRMIDGERSHRPGLDLTFSAPKSVSIAALVYGDERLIEAHDAAVRTAMKHVEDHLVQTRTFVNGSLKVQTGGNIVAGLFRHDTSRQLDPQLHTHAVIANQVYHPNGEATALYTEHLFRAQKLGSSIYRNELARAASELGYEVAREGKHLLVVLRDVPTTLVENYSKRSAEIKAALEERGAELTPRNAELAALATRAAKHKDVDRDELRRAWDKEASALGIDRSAMAQTIDRTKNRARLQEPGQSRDDDPQGWGDGKDALRLAIAHLSERNLHYSKVDLQATALDLARTAGLDGVSQAMNAALRSGELLPVKVPGRDDVMLTDTATLQMEREIATEVRRGAKAKAIRLNSYASLLKLQNLNGQAALSARLNRTSLSDGQKDAVTLALSSKGRVVGVQGYAGTGKTFMLGHLRKEAERAGYEVIGLAPSTKAVAELQEALPGAGTLQGHLMRRGPAGDHNPKKTIYVIDEASMVGNAQMRDFLRLAANDRTARVVLVGDVQQLDAVSAGTPFALLQKIGMPTAVMDDIVRQRNDTSLAIVKHAIAGDVRAAFEQIGDRISESSNPARAAALHYLGLSAAERKTTGVLTPTNAAREEINAVIRDGLKQEGSLAAQDILIRSLTPHGLTRAQLADPRTWEAGDVVLAHESFKAAGLRKGHLYDVVSSDEASRFVLLKDRATGDKITLPLKQSGKSTSAVELFEEGTRGFAIGDDVTFRITDKFMKVHNGQSGQVVGHDANGLKVRLESGETRTLPSQSLAAVGLDHAYALTGHGYQGATVDNIIVAMSATETLADQKSFYVAVSRPRDSVTLATTDVAALAERLERQTGQTIPALEAWLAARLERDREEPQNRSDEASKETRKDPEKTDAKDPEKVSKDDPVERQSQTDSERKTPLYENPRNVREVLLNMTGESGRKDLEEYERILNQKQLGDLER